MTFFEFLESRQVSKGIELQIDYSVYKQSEGLAITALISWQRNFFKFINFYKNIGLFLAYKVGFVPAPRDSKEIVKEYLDRAAESKKVVDALAKSPENVLSSNKLLKA